MLEHLAFSKDKKQSQLKQQGRETQDDKEHFSNRVLETATNRISLQDLFVKVITENPKPISFHQEKERSSSEKLPVHDRRGQ